MSRRMAYIIVAASLLAALAASAACPGCLGNVNGGGVVDSDGASAILGAAHARDGHGIPLN